MLISIPISMGIMFPLGRIMHKIARATQAEMAKFSGILGVYSEIFDLLRHLVRRRQKEKRRKGNSFALWFWFERSENPSNYLTRDDLNDDEYPRCHPWVRRFSSVKWCFVSGYARCNHLFHVSNYYPICADGVIFHFIPKSGGATERIQHILEMDSEASEGQTQLFQRGQFRFDRRLFFI